MLLASLDKKNHGKYIHCPVHDLESLLHMILGIVTFTAGPCGQICAPNEHIPLAQWYNETDLKQLHKDKAINLISYEDEIQGYIHLKLLEALLSLPSSSYPRYMAQIKPTY